MDGWMCGWMDGWEIDGWMNGLGQNGGWRDVERSKNLKITQLFPKPP